MEVEKTPPEMAKKMWKIVRIVFYMMRKTISKSKLMLDLHTLLKKSKTTISNKASTLLHHHRYYSALTCRSEADISFISPRDYEFSCSNSPAVFDIFHPNPNKRRNHHNRHNHYSIYYNNPHVMHKMLLDMLNRYDGVEASPLPGFGRSPVVQLRVTDSPFEAVEENRRHGHQVDRDAEEFIKKFYKDLKHQRKIAALEPPSPYHNMYNIMS